MADARAVALIEAAVIASSVLEVHDRAELEIIRRHVSTPALGLALAMVEHEAEFAPRWRAAGTDWMARAEVLRDAVLFVLTPENRGDA
jgi:hypothetical protein